MNQRWKQVFLLLPMATFCFVGVTFSGCGESTPVSTKVATKRKALPKLEFHKPRNYALAVERISQIHESLLAEADFPTPTSYTVVEVESEGGEITQASYQLVEGSYESEANEACCDHHCDHEGEEHAHSHRDPFAVESEKLTVIVDAFTELNDIVKWLPSIASGSDLYSADIDSIKSASQTMLSALDPVENADTEESKLKTYRTNADELGTSVKQLKELVKENSAKILAD